MPDPSSGYLFTGFSTLLILICLVTLATGKPARPLMWLAGLVQIALFGSTIYEARARMGDLRVELQQVRFGPTAPDTPLGVQGGRIIRIGDDRKSDDLVVARQRFNSTRLGSDFARISLSTPACPAGQAPCLLQDRMALRNGLITVGQSDGQTIWSGAIPFNRMLCFGAHRVSLDSVGKRLVVDGRTAMVDLPTRNNRVALLRDFGVTDPHIRADRQPLRDVESFLVVIDGRLQLVLADVGAGFADNRCHPEPAALKQLPLGGARLRIFSLEKASAASFLSAVRNNDEGDDLPRTMLVERRSMVIREDGDLSVDLDTPDTIRIDYSKLAREQIDDRGGRSISLGNLGAILQGSKVEESRFMVLGDSVASQIRQLIRLKGAGCTGEDCQPDIDGGAIGRVAHLTRPAGSRIAELGENLKEQLERDTHVTRYILGAQTGDRVVVEIDRLDFGFFPFLLAAMIGGVGLLVSMLSTATLRQRNASLFAILLLLDYLLTLRLLIGFESAYVDPGPRTIFALLAAALAICAVPQAVVSLAAWLAPADHRRGRWGIAFYWLNLIAAGLLLFVCHQWVGGRTWINYQGLAIGPIALFALPVIGSLIPFRRLVAGSDFLARKWRLTSEESSVGAISIEAAPRRPTTTFLTILTCVGLIGLAALWGIVADKPMALVTLILTLLLAIMGSRVLREAGPWESGRLSIWFGVLVWALGVAALVSISYVMTHDMHFVIGTLAGAGALTVLGYRGLQARKGLSIRLNAAIFRALAWWIFVVSVLGAVYATTHDTGFIVVNVVATTIAMWGICGGLRWAGSAFAERALGPPMLATAILALLTVPLIGLAPPPLPDKQVVAESASAQYAALDSSEPELLDNFNDTLRRTKDFNRYLERWYSFASPSHTGASGTSESEAARSSFYYMSEYASQGPWGRGFLNQPTPTGLRAAHFSDYSVSVHVMTPFGRAGAAAMNIMLLLAALIVTKNVFGTASNPISIGALGAVSGVWLLFAGSLYMTLANILVVPFTGRNVYMLSPISILDLADGLVLILPACLWGLRYPVEHQA